MPYIEKKTYAGDLLEIDRYYAMRDGKKYPRGKNVNESIEEQNTLNNKNAQRRLVLLINNNFSRKQNDIFVTLTYREPPEDEATVKKDFNKFSRKVRAYRKENGLPELKYIAIPEKQGQWHHHVIMNDLPLNVINELWGRGKVTISTLDDKYTFHDLANYLLKQDKKAKIKSNSDNTEETRRKYARRWNSSKNLKIPVPKTRIIKRVSKTLPPPPKGYRLLPDWKIGCDKFGNIFQHYSCVREEEPTPKTNTKRRN